MAFKRSGVQLSSPPLVKHLEFLAIFKSQVRPAMPAGQGAQHLVLTSNHPSPLAALRPPLPFIGCGHFGGASEFLAAAGRGGLGWELAPSGPVL